MRRKLLITELNRKSVEEYKKSAKRPLIIVLDNVRSQHNIGSVFRSADAFAVEKILLCGISATPPSAEIHKAALGAEESVDWEYCQDSATIISRLKKDGYTILSVEQTENSTPLNDFSPEKGEKYAIVFGHEIRGVSQQVVDMSDAVIEIPQFGTKHSLNVSVAVGVVLWEICKIMDSSTLY